MNGIRDAIYMLLKLDTKQAKDSTDALTKGAEKSEKQIKRLDKSIDNLGKVIKTAFQETPIIGFIASLKKAIDVMGKVTQKESDYIESLNLLYVAYGKNSESADRLIYSLNQLLGLDPSKLTRQLGVYRQFSDAMGIANDKASLLAENLLKLQADVSSLYNLDFATAGKKLQSAIAGQTRPVRELGADITEASLQQELYNRGIDASVKEMNRASKSVLIYLALETQLRNANQDAGATINQLAQQMKVFKEQTDIAGRQLGAVFIPILKTILPYANAILMVFNELMNMLLKLLGVDVKAMAKQGIGNRSLIEDFDDLSSSIDKTAESSKKAKLSLRDFDKLHNITTPTNGSGGVGGGIGGALTGVDSRLLDALKEYDLGEINQKAAKIRDTVMEWLGFARDVNGEWKFSKITLGTIVGGLVAGGGLIWAVTKVWNTLRKVKALGSGVTSLLGLGKSTKALSEASALSKATHSFTLPKFSTVLKGLGELALIIGGIGALVIAIGELTRIPGFNEVLQSGIDAVVKLFKGLGEVFLPIAGFSVLITGLGIVSSVVVSGILSLAGVIGGTEVLIGAIGLLASIPEVRYVVGQGLDLTIKVFNGLHEIIVPLAEFSLLIVGLGITSGAVVPGILSFAAIVGSLETLMGAIGVLSSIPYVKEFVQGGAEMMIYMAQKLGEMAGAIVKGFVGKAMETIPDFGTNLSGFMTNAQGFFVGLKNVPAGAMDSVSTLTGAILKLAAAEFINGLTRLADFFTGGFYSKLFGSKGTLIDFGKQLSQFAPHLVSFSSKIQSLNEGDINKTKIAIAITGEWVNLAKDLPRTGVSLISLVAGDNSLYTFGAHLELYAQNIVNYASTISTLNSNATKNTETVVAITRKWVELAKDIPRMGTSLASLIAGNDSLGALGVELRNYGASLKTYSETINNLSFEKMDKTILVTNDLIDVAVRIKNNSVASGSYLEDFGEDLEEIGENIEDYYNYVKNIDATKLNQVTDAVNMMVYTAKEIKNNGLKGYLSSFSNELSLSSTGISRIFSVSNGESLGTNFGKAVARKIASAIKNYSFPSIKITLPGITTPLATYNLKAYQNGGFVDSGEIFLANENGVPEMLGKFGSRTAVANNDQIVEGITMGVARGMQSAKLNQPVVIKAEADTSGLLNFINFEQEKRNRQYGL